MAHFAKPTGNTTGSSYEVTNRLAPGSVSRMQIAPGVSGEIAIWGADGLQIQSTNPSVIANSFPERRSGALRIITLKSNGPCGTSQIRVGDGIGNVVTNLWITLDVQVAPASLAWGAKVSLTFKDKVIRVARNLGMDADNLMACMAFESGGTFSPSIKNAAGSGAVGLIQFMPSTAKALGTTTASLAAMSAEDQLDYVEKFLTPYRNRLKTLEDVYMAILWPAAIGKANSYVLFTKPDKTYTQNQGLDLNKDGKVTKSEAATAVRNSYLKGLGFRG
jgi:hypothetical protein